MVTREVAPKMTSVNSHMITDIDPSSVQYIGHGSFGIVYSCTIHNKKYALKIGKIHSDDYYTLKSMNKHKLTVDVYAFNSYTQLPQTLRDVCETEYNYHVEFGDFAHFIDVHGYTSIMIMALAKPMVNHATTSEDHWSKLSSSVAYRTYPTLKLFNPNAKRLFPLTPQALKLIRAITMCQRKMLHITNEEWADCHIGNIGMYNNHYVILDF